MYSEIKEKPKGKIKEKESLKNSQKNTEKKNRTEAKIRMERCRTDDM